MLWADGRTGNTQRMGFEKIGLKPYSRGQLSVNNLHQTKVKNIFLVDNVVGWSSLDGAAYDQGRAASNAIVAPDESSP